MRCRCSHRERAARGGARCACWVSIRSAWRVVAAAITITLVGVVAVRSRRHPEAMARDGATTPSIAVLPFTNVGHDTAAEYFADGIANELATALVRIPGLRVAARSSAFTFRGIRSTSTTWAPSCTLVRCSREASVARRAD